MKKIFTIFIISVMLTSFFALNIKFASAQAYTLISEIDTSITYASNTLYTWSVRVSPVPNVTTIIFKPSWMTEIRNTTDPNTGRAIFYAKTPPTAQGKSHTITFSSPENLFQPLTLTIKTEIGITSKITYYSTQFYNPEGVDDIIIYVEPIETDYGVGVTPTTWDITAKKSDGSIYKGNIWGEVSTGKWQIYFNLGDSSSVVSTYEIKVALSLSQSGITYVTVPNTASVNVGTPKIIAKAISDVDNKESWIVMDPSGYRNTASALFISKGVEYIYVEFYDTKLHPITPTDYDFILYTSTGKVSFKDNSLYVETTELPNRFKIWYLFTESSYDLEVYCKRGIIYDEFRETLKINTEKKGFNIWDWILNPYFMILVLFILMVIAFSVKGKAKKRKEE